MTSPKPKQPATEEIEWTDEDEAAANRAMEKLRKKLGGKLPSQIKREQEEGKGT